MAVNAQSLAQIYGQLERGDIAGALAAIEGAVASDPDNAGAWQLAGIIRRRTGRGEAAVEAFRRAIAGGLKTAEIRNSLGLALQELGRAEEAAGEFAAAIKLNQDYLPAQVNAAKAKAVAGQWGAARKALRKVLSKHPGSALVRNALAQILNEQGEVQGAADEYARVLSTSPQDIGAAIRLGKALRDLGRGEEALAHFRTHYSRFAASPEYTEAMSGALVDTGRIGEAEALLEQTVQAKPGYFSAHRSLARLAREYGTGKDAYRTYRALVQRWPGEQSIWLDWLQLMASYRDYHEIAQLAQEAEGHLGATTAVSFFKAIGLSETGDVDAAEDLFAKIQQATGETGAFLVARSRNALMLGEYKRAEQWLTRVTEENREDQYAWAYLGLAWRMMGDEREFWLHDYDVQTGQLAIEHLNDAAEMEELRETLRRLHNTADHPPEQSLRGGTQTPGALFARPEPVIVKLREAIREKVEAFARSLPEDKNHPFYRRKADHIRFTGSWSVRLRGEGFHIVHLHQEGWISSALHLVMPGCGEADAQNAGCLTLGQPPAEMGLDLPARRIVQPVEGSLVLFPSSMWHGTVPFAGGERMTVAFDAVPA